jgi:hypothetical protein
LNSGVNHIKKSGESHGQCSSRPTKFYTKWEKDNPPRRLRKARRFFTHQKITALGGNIMDENTKVHIWFKTRVLTRRNVCIALLATMLVGGLFILATLTSQIGVASAGEKIVICHVPPGNPGNAHTIEVDRNAWENGHSPHNAHSLDYEGECDEPEPTDEPTQEATLTPMPTELATSTPKPTEVVPPTQVGSPTPTENDTPVPTLVGSPTPTDEGSPIPSASPTPFPTSTRTPLPTPGSTPTSTKVPENPGRPRVIPSATAILSGCPSEDCVYVDFLIDEKADMDWVVNSLHSLEDAGYWCPECVKIRVLFDESADINWVPDALEELARAGYECGIVGSR